jgi:hypothetical protein
MCGPTSAQTSALNQQTSLQATLQQEAETTYGEDQGILSQLKATYEPIVAAGPNQEGYSPEELAALNTQSTEGTAQNYAEASRAVGESQAAQGGGNAPGITSGVNAQQNEQLAASAAQEQSKEQTGITTADYQQGYKEFQDATGALLGTSGQLNPLGYSGQDQTAITGESNEANTLAAQQSSWVAPVLGAAGAIGGGFAGDFSFGSNP